MDSKVLIKHCNDAGVHVKASALASISPEERDIVMNYLSGLSTDTPQQESAAPLAPVREASGSVGGKVRSIRTMTPRAQPLRSSRMREQEAADSAQTVAEDSNQVVATAETEGAVADAPEDVHTDSEVVATPDDDIQGTEPVGDTEVDSPDQESTDSQGVVPISRDDYVPAGGAGPGRIREMKPRGTTADRSGQQSRPVTKAKGKQALPNVAAPPSIKLPKVKKASTGEQPAQKPELRLTGDLLDQQSPLASHLKKNAEQKRRRGDDSGSEFRDTKRSRDAVGGLGLEEGRQQRREKRRQSRQVVDDEVRVQRTRGLRRRRQKGGAPAELKTSAQIELPITLRGLSEAMGRPVSDLQRALMAGGYMITINDTVTEEIALELAMEVGVDLEIRRPRDIEDELQDVWESDEDEATLTPRPPIITILGHVDHGKTSLLDRIRSSKVAAGEAGGITQHIASYQVEHGDHKLTFVDTPGHAAFGEMRARGANVTDIVVLVVAADDGVMPQTVECISHAKATGVPIVVALNKIDLPDVNIPKIQGDLAANEVVPQEWGGDVEVVKTSAETGEGIDDLLETLLLTAELHEFKANPERSALGICLEASRDEGRGALASLIVQKGTLRVGDIVLCGPAYGRIRAMYDHYEQEIEEAGPSTPIKVAGLDIVPGAGDRFHVVDDIDEAREAAEGRRHRGRTEVLSGRGRPRTLDDILNAARGGTVQDLALIVKADTPGSLEALRSEIDKFDHPEVRVKILHEGVGGVNESDVYLASASDAIIIAFHVIPEDRAMILAEKESVEIRRYNIIYEVTAQIKRVLEGLLEPEKLEVATGRALVLQTFHISRFGTIAGCRILNGTIERSNRVHVIRDQTVLNNYDIASLRREKDDVKEVREGMECGIRLAGFNDVKEGDLLEAYRIEEKKRTLDG